MPINVKEKKIRRPNIKYGIPVIGLDKNTSRLEILLNITAINLKPCAVIKEGSTKVWAEIDPEQLISDPNKSSRIYVMIIGNKRLLHKLIRILDFFTSSFMLSTSPKLRSTPAGEL